MIKLYEDVKTKDHDEWEDKCDYDKGEPCLICGKPVKPTANINCFGLFVAVSSSLTMKVILRMTWGGIQLEILAMLSLRKRHEAPEKLSA